MTRKPPQALINGRPRCGGYTVRRRGDRLIVRCSICGPAASLTPAGARLLAKELRGPLARFETTAPHEERIALAALLELVAGRIEAAAHRRALAER